MTYEEFEKRRVEHYEGMREAGGIANAFQDGYGDDYPDYTYESAMKEADEHYEKYEQLAKDANMTLDTLELFDILVEKSARKLFAQADKNRDKGMLKASLGRRVS